MKKKKEKKVKQKTECTQRPNKIIWQEKSETEFKQERNEITRREVRRLKLK